MMFEKNFTKSKRDSKDSDFCQFFFQNGKVDSGEIFDIPQKTWRNITRISGYPGKSNPRHPGTIQSRNKTHWE